MPKWHKEPGADRYTLMPKWHKGGRKKATFLPNLMPKWHKPYAKMAQPKCLRACREGRSSHTNKQKRRICHVLYQSKRNDLATGGLIKWHQRKGRASASYSIVALYGPQSEPQDAPQKSWHCLALLGLAKDGFFGFLKKGLVC